MNRQLFSAQRFELLLFFMILVSQALFGGTYLHPKLKTGEKTIRSVVLLLPTAQMKAKGPRRYDYKEEEAEQIASALASLVSDALKQRGWAVDDSTFIHPPPENREQLKNLVKYMRFRHERLFSQIEPKDVAKGKYSLGDRVAALNNQVPADAVVLVHAEGFRYTTGGVIAGAILDSILTRVPIYITLPMLLEEDISLRISLVDSQTGEILCHVKTSGLDEEKILKELRKVP